MKNINEYYDSIQMKASPEQMAQRVLSAAEKEKRGQKRFRFKGTTAFAAAAAAVLALGATAAAVTLGFNSIFDGRVISQDAQLAEELMLSAKNVNWSISDEAYTIELQGITGSATDIVVRYDILRKDGRPVKDFFVNLPEDGQLTALMDIRGLNDDMVEYTDTHYIFARYEDIVEFNEDGNISVYERIAGSGDISGTEYSHRCVNLYPKQLLKDFEDENDVWAISGFTVNFPDPCFTTGSGEELRESDIPINDERVLGLELSWELTFDYQPAGKALESKKLLHTGEIDDIRFDYTSHSLATPVCSIGDSLFTCVGGWMALDRDGADNVDFSVSEKYNEVFIIMEDGTHIPVVLMSGMSSSGTKGTYLTEVKYSETVDGQITVIDIAKAEAISINGAVYELG